MSTSTRCGGSSVRYDEWKKTKEQLQQAHKDASAVESKAYKKLNDHKDPIIQVTLPSGTRTTIGDIDGPRLVITAANEHGFLTLGMLSIPDLEVFLEIRRAIDAWKRGELDEFPWPAYEFAPWRGVKK